MKTLEAQGKVKSVVERAPIWGTQPVLNPAQWVPAEVHKTPASVMKLSLPKRIRELVKRHGSPLMVIDRNKLIEEYKQFSPTAPTGTALLRHQSQPAPGHHQNIP
ncbi:MAG: hypothetical protein HC898_06225 [Phycisphaerales bacterium]|nr:hypothetical protein [Phycisphaerales bacterium]